MTEPSELVERLAAVVDPRYSDEFVGKMIRANWPDIHAALSAMTDPLAMAKAIEPVLHWYQSDEHDPRPLADILADIVADLQSDRAIAIKTRALVKAADWLSVHAQTSGGTAGSDAKLIEAIDQYGRVRSAIDPATLEVNRATD